MCEHADLRFHDGVQVKYCASLVTNLKSRFTDLPIVSCFASFDPSFADTNYGNDQIRNTLHSLQIGFNVVQAGVWMGFKEVIRRAYTQTCSNIMNELLFSNYSLAYPLLSKLAVALPLSNAECERGFSAISTQKPH